MTLTYYIDRSPDPGNLAVDHVVCAKLFRKFLCTAAHRPGIALEGPDGVGDNVDHGDDLLSALQLRSTGE